MGELEGVLDLKPEGKKHKITKKIKELREKLEKEGNICYIDSGLLEEPSVTSLKMARSHTIKENARESI
jgi:hypothetical protein